MVKASAKDQRTSMSGASEVSIKQTLFDRAASRMIQIIRLELFKSSTPNRRISQIKQAKWNIGSTNMVPFF